MFGRAIHLFGRAVRETGQAIDRLGLRIDGTELFNHSFSRHRPILNVLQKVSEMHLINSICDFNELFLSVLSAT